MKTLAYFGIIVFFIGCSTSKEIKNSNTSFLIQLPKLENIKKIENKHHGVEVVKSYSIGLSDQYFPGVKNFKFAQPKIYNRKNETLKTVVSYFYTDNDKTVRLIEYSWDRLKDSDSIKNIYHQNELAMNQYFQKDGIQRIDDDPTYWQEELSWENDKIFVFQFILGDKSKKAYRTRLIVRQK